MQRHLARSVVTELAAFSKYCQLICEGNPQDSGVSQTESDLDLIHYGSRK